MDDELALRRAAAVRDVLVGAGIARSRIQIVSMGPRRPADFATTDAAARVNRRVEVLIPLETAARIDPADGQDAGMPECPTNERRP